MGIEDSCGNALKKVLRHVKVVAAYRAQSGRQMASPSGAPLCHGSTGDRRWRVQTRRLASDPKAATTRRRSHYRLGIATHPATQVQAQAASVDASKKKPHNLAMRARSKARRSDDERGARRVSVPMTPSCLQSSARLQIIYTVQYCIAVARGVGKILTAG